MFTPTFLRTSVYTVFTPKILNVYTKNALKTPQKTRTFEFGKHKKKLVNIKKVVRYGKFKREG